MGSNNVGDAIVVTLLGVGEDGHRQQCVFWGESVDVIKALWFSVHSRVVIGGPA
jgi:hypothetical protein